MKKNVQKEEAQEEVLKEGQSEEPSELLQLVVLWEQLKALGVNSISDLEVKIARLQ